MAAKQIKIILLGESNVGKTSLMHRYGEDQFYPNTDDLLKTEFMEKSLTIDGLKVYVALWDPSGFTSGTTIGNSFYDGADGCCLVFSTVDKKSFERLVYWYEDVVRHCGREISFVFAENKIDLIDRSEIDAKLVESLAKEHKFRLYRVSAKENHNVDDLFRYLIEKCLKKHLTRTVSLPKASSSDCLDSVSSLNVGRPTETVERSQSAEPSRRRTGGVKPVFNRHKCPMM